MKKVFFTLSFLLFTISHYASHFSSGAFITYNCLGGNVFEVVLTVYEAPANLTPGTSLTLDFTSSCAPSFNRVIPVTLGASIPQICNVTPSLNYQEYVCRDTVILTNCSDWVISWNLCCRNGAITNLTSSSSNSNYVETALNNALIPCNNSPQPINSTPTFRVRPNQFTKLNMGAIDEDGDSLNYTFTNTLTNSGITIPFAVGYSLTQPINTNVGVTLNQATGEMCFTPSFGQVSVVTILIEEYRNGLLIGSILRDAMIVVEPSVTAPNQPPTPLGLPLSCGGNNGIATSSLQGSSVTQIDSNSFSMCSYNNICFSIDFSDFDGDSVYLTSNAGSSFPSGSFNIIGNGTLNAIGTFCWTPTLADTGTHFLIVRAEDNSCPLTAKLAYVYEIEVLNQINAGPDQTICGIQEAQLNASISGNNSWSVLSGDPIVIGSNFSCNTCNNPIAKPAITTTYLLTNNSPSSCQTIDTITIFVAPDFTTTTTSDTLLCATSPVNISLQANNLSTPGAGYTINWSPSTTLNDPTLFSPIATPIVSTQYYASVTSSLGCKKLDSTKVAIAISPQLIISPGNSTICEAQTVNLNVESPCIYTLKMYDNLGDGWNGQSLQVRENGNPLGSYTIGTLASQGDSNIVTFNVLDGNILDIIYYSGAGQNQSSFELIDGNGNTLFSVAPGGMVGWISNSVVYNSISNCAPVLNSFSWSPGLSLNDSTISNPIASPLLSETYTLNVTDTSSCVFTDSITITTSNHIASFTFTDNGNGNYSFNNTSTGSFTQSHWGFGDGNTSSVLSPNHTFNANGTYLVVLTINNSIALGNNCIDYYIDTINVTGVINSPTCNAGFVTYPDTNGISVYNSSIGNSLTYLWDFGDGNTSNIQNPSHTYVTSGPFYLCLTIDDGNGCIDTYCDSIGSDGTVFKQAGFTINVSSLPVITDVDDGKTLSTTLSLYPNPVKNKFKLINKNLPIEVINIIDITGKKLRTITTDFNSIDVTKLSPGIYFLEIISNENTIIKKFVKQ